jgi:hypothetical protein
MDKYYNYNKLGHFTTSCPEPKKADLYKIEEGLAESQSEGEDMEQLLLGNEEP